MNIWVAGFVVWFVLLVVTFRYCSGWRSQIWAYGLAPIALLLQWAVRAQLGSYRAKGGGEVVAYSFWVAAVYLGVLLTAELALRQKAES